MKRVFVLGLALLLLIVLVPTAEAAAYKIGLITGTVSQGEEEYRAAENMVAKYGSDMIIHVTYPDNFMVEQETTMSQITRMGFDPEIKAIVICQAVPGSVPAIERVKKFRDDIVFILGLPHEDPDYVAGVVDFAMETDQLTRGITIPQKAYEMGAKKFLHYSFPRHLSMELLAQRYEIMKKESERLGMEFISVTAPDPMGDAGIPGTQQFVIEDIPRQAAQHGKDIAFFGTNCAMMEPAIQASLQAGIIFPEQCCPSPYHGFPGALGIEIPEDKAGDVDYIVEQITLKVAEHGATGRFSTWVAPINMVFVEAGVAAAIRWIEEGLDFSDVDALEALILSATGLKINMERYSEEGNFYLLTAESVIF